MKRILAILAAVILLVTGGQATLSYADEPSKDTVPVSELQTDDEFYLGSYPQSLVTDKKLIVALNQLNISMQSYGYLVNSTEDVGMTYGDVIYQGNRYRKVQIGNTYRPRATGDRRNGFDAQVIFEEMNYALNQSYWFLWEPVKWQVIANTEAGVTALTKGLLDGQPFQNAPAENLLWADADLREWMNTTMADTLFSENEKTKLLLSVVPNPGNPDGGNYIGYSDDTLDLLWSLDFSDLTDENGFGNRTVKLPTGGVTVERTKLQAVPTDYACCQGVYASNKNYASADFWMRSVFVNAGETETKACMVKGSSEFSYRTVGDVTYVEGVRPCLTLDSRALVSLTADTAEPLPCTHENTLSRVTKPAAQQLDGLRQTVCAGCGEVLSTEKIRAIDSITLTSKSLVYSGSEQQAPPVTVLDAEGHAVSADNYTVTCVSRADGSTSKTVRDVGQYKLRVAFQNDYSGTKDLYFSVKPHSIAPVAAVKTGGTVTVQWTPAANAAGYELELSTAWDFSKNTRTVTVDDGTLNSVSVRLPENPFQRAMLAGKTGWFVRIRVCQVIACDGGEAYTVSPWSIPMAVSSTWQPTFVK
ncbi:MAG: hypothetical protein IJ168_03530 [Eubacterium sp.]|nr:hypothetical protein [Eubacterium sp.]